VKYLITGITGQDGAYLARLLTMKGHDVAGTTTRITPNLSRLNFLGLRNLSLNRVQLNRPAEVRKIVNSEKPDVIINLAGVSSVSLSEDNPTEALSENIFSSFNVLNAAREFSRECRVVLASSSEIYGETDMGGAVEGTAVSPTSVYGLSKSINGMVGNYYSDKYDLPVLNCIFFNHESGLRWSNFLIGRVLDHALDFEPGSERMRFGEMLAIRDFGLAQEYMHTLIELVENGVTGDVNFCTGKPTTLRSVIEQIYRNASVDPEDAVVFDDSLNRKDAIHTSVGNPEKLNGMSKSKRTPFGPEYCRVLIQEKARFNDFASA